MFLWKNIIPTIPVPEDLSFTIENVITEDKKEDCELVEGPICTAVKPSAEEDDDAVATTTEPSPTEDQGKCFHCCMFLTSDNQITNASRQRN